MRSPSRAYGLALFVLGSPACGAAGPASVAPDESARVQRARPAEPSGSTQPARRDGEVTVTKNIGQNKVLRLQFSRGELELQMRSEPLIDEHRLWLGVGVPSLGDCGVQITLGDRVLALEPPRRRTAVKTGQTIWLNLDYEDLAEIARAASVMVRACEHEVQLEQGDRDLVRKFTRLLFEELVQNGTATPEDELDGMDESALKAKDAGSADP